MESTGMRFIVIDAYPMTTGYSLNEPPDRIEASMRWKKNVIALGLSSRLCQALQ
jgi:hypothetical protein